MNHTDAEAKSYARGILLVLVTTLLWGFLPIILKVALTEFSAGTIAWFRFLFAFVVLYLLLSLRGSHPALILRRPPILGIVAGASLSANYFGVTEAVNLSTPSNAAILIQLAPVLLAVVGVLFFKERLTPLQMVGFAVAAVGFYLFYIDQRGNVKDMTHYSTATVYIMFAAVVWVLYISCQKLLSRSFGAQSLNLLVYGVAAVVLVYKVNWVEFTGIGWKGWTVLVVLGLNTLLAYGALAESVKHVPLTIISPLITLNPLITLTGMLVLPALSSGRLMPEIIGTWGYLGAVTAVGGVVLVIARK